MSLAWIPKGILSRIQKLCCRFLWNGYKEGKPFAWVGLRHIAIPKKWGGCGLKGIPSFANAIAAKMGWLILTSHSLWTEVIQYRYIWLHHLLNWIHLPTWQRPGISMIWRKVLHTLPTIRNGLT